MTQIKSRSDVVNEVAAQVDMPQTEVDRVIRAYESAILRQAAAGGQIRMTGFGTFKVTHRAARVSRNPRTGEPSDVAERNAIRFVPGQALKEAAAASFKADESAPDTSQVQANGDPQSAPDSQSKPQKNA